MLILLAPGQFERAFEQLMLMMLAPGDFCESLWAADVECWLPGGAADAP